MRMILEPETGVSRATAFSVSKEFAWIGLGQIVAAVGAIAGVRWLTRWMDLSLYGELGLALTGITLIQQSVGGPIAQSVIRYFASASEDGSLPEYFHALFQMLHRATLLIAGVSLLTLCGMWLSGHRAWIIAIFLTSFIALMTGYNLTFEAVQNASRDRKAVAWHQGLIQWLRPLLAVAFLLLFGISIESALTGYALATILVVCSQWIFIRRQFGCSLRFPVKAFSPKCREMDQRMRTYAWPFASWGLLCWSQLASDRWLLEFFHGAPAVGAYTVCYQLGYYPMILISTALGGLITPILFKTAGSGEDLSRVQNAVRTNALHISGLLLVTLCATAGAVFYGAWVLRAFTSKAYAPFASTLPILVLGGGLFACGQAVSLVLLLEGQSSQMVRTKIATAILGVVFNAIGAYFFGVAGAAWATLCFGLLYLIAMLKLTQRSQSAAWSAGWSGQPEPGA
jgi:O-antigen/teichoic acid export membrane protein